MKSAFWCLLLGLIALLPLEVHAQTFGQNKARYRTFDFSVFDTDHFSVYHYSKNREAIQYMADWSEQWYDAHYKIFQEKFPSLNPLIYYNDHADFQQTNAIFGEIGVGTGGVTEGFKNRVILPFTMINQQTHHVIGHELVHAFQYNTILNGDSTNLESLGNLPLWMVEGLAEYLSIGRSDPFTAMWMRDAVLQDDVPTLQKLADYRYFPYRYGQAFWAFFAGTYGDDMIMPLFRNTAKYGLEVAVPFTLGITFNQLSTQYTETLKTFYGPIINDAAKTNAIGKELISDEKNSQRLNISPVLSPDGKYVIYLSDKNLFSTDLYLADAREGKILRKITSILKDGNVDDNNYLESAGTWSPDSKQFLYVAFSKGYNIFVIKNPQNGKTIKHIRVPGVNSLAHPTWSPDGKTIVFTGMVEGQTDLYSYDLKSNKVKQLTDDFYSEVYGDYSPDGRYIIFSSDRKSFNQKRVDGKWKLHLSRLDLSTLTIEDYLSIFPGADNIDPEFDENGNVYFLSDRDGTRNLYRTNLQGEVLQMTKLKTGISGISQYSPAISVANREDRISYSYYFKSGYKIYAAKSDRFLNQPVDPADVSLTEGSLPVVLDIHKQIVSGNMVTMEPKAPQPDTGYINRPYKSKFKLDYIANSGVGVSVGGIGARTGLAGGVSMIFSDLLGNNQLFATAALNGDIYDFGLAVQYLNQKHRVAWGITASHIPLLAGYYDQFQVDSLPLNTNGKIEGFVLQENLLRLFDDQISGVVQYPFNKFLRVEGGLGFHYRFFRLDRREYYYDTFGFFLTQSRRKRIPLSESIFNFDIRNRPFYSQYVALVGDHSIFGMASPISGYRFRFDFTNYSGAYKYQTTLNDVRLYHRLAPVTLALRMMHYATLGNNGNFFYPFLIGENGLVHGYNYGRLNEIQYVTGVTPSQLSGTKLLLSNFEVRLPFTGPKELAVIKSNFLFTELNFFFDGGIAFNDYKDLGKQADGTEPKLVFSTGASLRVNLFGALVIEPFLVFPLLRGNNGGLPPKFGVFLGPGW